MRLVALVLVLCVGASARADDDLTEVARLEGALEYDQALVVVARILQRGTATDPAQVAELYFYAGRLAAGLDRPDEARGHFAIALALKPDLALPPGTSPKLLAPFEQAHATMVALRVHATTEGKVIADADPLGIVARTDVVGHEARALDAYGNVVWRGAVPRVRHAPMGPGPAAPPIAARWSTWAIVSGATAIAGGLCAWRFQVAQDEWNEASQDGKHDYTQLRAIEQRGNRWAIGADVGFGVAAAAGVTAIILNVLQSRPIVLPVMASDRSVGLAITF